MSSALILRTVSSMAVSCDRSLLRGGALLEHFPEKWAPVFRRKCDRTKEPSRPAGPGYSKLFIAIVTVGLHNSPAEKAVPWRMTEFRGHPRWHLPKSP